MLIYNCLLNLIIMLANFDADYLGTLHKNSTFFDSPQLT